jgi:ribonuclease P protein component
MSLKTSQRFPKTARLRKRAEFLRLAHIGAKVQSTNFIFIISPNGRAENRLGVTVSAKVGNSVVRNRVKRHVREYFRRHRAELPAASDIVIIARNSAAGLEGNRITGELERSLAGLRKNRRA